MDTSKIQKIWKVVRTIIELLLAALGGALVEHQSDVISTFISNF